MPKVIILTAGYGEGHNAAARGLEAALAEQGADVAIVDILEVTGGTFYQRSRRAYIDLINRAPRIWAAIYQLLDRPAFVSLTLPLLGTMRRALRQVLEREKPDAVISVYPVYGYLIAGLYPGARPFAFHTVVTDSITINSVWYRCASDTFFVPNDETARVMSSAGVAEDKLRRFGFPVLPRFARGRRARALPPPARVLYMVNAGRQHATGIVRRLLAVGNFDLTVTVGRDAELGEALQSIAAELGTHLEVHGWTPKMPELLISNHLLIGKAGGATVQEAIAAGTPMLLTQIIPGQEEGNAQLLLQNECGAFAPTADALANSIGSAFTNDAALWRRWESNIKRLSRPDAAREIARFILENAMECSPSRV